MTHAFKALVHASGIFDRLERFRPSDRAALFYALESRWCWDCGHEQSDDEKHVNCANTTHEQCPSLPVHTEGST